MNERINGKMKKEAECFDYDVDIHLVETGNPMKAHHKT